LGKDFSRLAQNVSTYIFLKKKLTQYGKDQLLPEKMEITEHILKYSTPSKNMSVSAFVFFF